MELSHLNMLLDYTPINGIVFYLLLEQVLYFVLYLVHLQVLVLLFQILHGRVDQVAVLYL